jgi:hypothetical protein
MVIGIFYTFHLDEWWYFTDNKKAFARQYTKALILT